MIYKELHKSTAISWRLHCHN